MSCFLEASEGVQTAVILLRREQLMYDIKNCLWIEGSVMPDETPAHNRHIVQDGGEDGNVDRISRVLDLCHSEVKEVLYSYTKHAIHDAEVENRLREPQTYGIVMSVPEDYSQTTLLYLEKLVHEYMVCRAVEDWLSITNPGKAEIWRMKAEEMLRGIRQKAWKRMERGSGRRRVSPF